MSVHHMPVFCQKYPQTFYIFKIFKYLFLDPQIFFTIGWPDLSSFSVPNGMLILRRGPPNGGVECEGV